MWICLCTDASLIIHLLWIILSFDLCLNKLPIKKKITKKDEARFICKVFNLLEINIQKYGNI